jgi:hypothetical protein
MSTMSERTSAKSTTVRSATGAWEVRGATTESESAFVTRIRGDESSIVGMTSIVREPNRIVGGKRGRHEKQQLKVKRRLQGFFIQEEGQEARVALVDNGTLVHYYLPLKLMHEGGVRAENQPFELDELELNLDGVVLSGHQIRASAPAEAGMMSPLPLSEDYQQKLERILRR